MAEYINRDAVLRDIEEAMKFRGLGCIAATAMERYIKRQPAADVYTEEDVMAAYTDGYSTGMAQGMEKAVRHGRWLINPDGYYPYCSECKNEPKGGHMTDFCPNCGARMDGE